MAIQSCYEKNCRQVKMKKFFNEIKRLDKMLFTSQKYSITTKSLKRLQIMSVDHFRNHFKISHLTFPSVDCKMLCEPSRDLFAILADSRMDFDNFVNFDVLVDDKNCFEEVGGRKEAVDIEGKTMEDYFGWEVDLMGNATHRYSRCMDLSVFVAACNSLACHLIN